MAKDIILPPDFKPPERGVDAHFDELTDRVWQAIELAGNPERLTLEAVRRKTARALIEKGGWRIGDTQEAQA